MEIILKPLEEKHLEQATALWNQIIREGNSFPGDKELTLEEARAMFEAQTATVCALDGEDVVGLYILHPNNIGRCGHIANSSYAVDDRIRGNGIGRLLVNDSVERARQHGFRGLQFNAVVATNYRAITLYLKLGFKIIGTIKGGYRLKDGSFEDTIIFLKSW